MSWDLGRSHVRAFFDRVPGGPVPVVVWLAAIATVVGMLTTRATGREYTGLARTIDYEVSVAAPGRISEVTVELYDAVEIGDVVATLDGAAVTALLESAAAELRALEAELERATLLAGSGGSREQLASRDNSRRFEVDVEDRKLEELALSVSIETDRVEAQRLESRLERVRPLFEQGVASPDEYDEVRLSHAAVRRRIEENLVALAATREKLAAAEERRRRFLDSTQTLDVDVDGFLAPLKARIDAQFHRVEGARASREALVLRAPVAGRVLAVVAHAGQSVVGGEAVALIAPRFTDEVIAYLPEGDARALHEFDRVRVVSDGWPVQVAESFIFRISPAFEALPQRLWRSATSPEYGRAFVVKLMQPIDITPGERVRVRISSGSS